MKLTACSKCGLPTHGARCQACGGSCDRPRRSGTYARVAKRVVENAVICQLCGKGQRPGDPFVADHIIPRAYGGSDGSGTWRPHTAAAMAERARRLGNRTVQPQEG
jgi:hypothetical protein